MMKNNCIFCAIAAKEIPAEKIRYEDEEIIAFDDINPKAKIHILFVPKKHIKNLNEATEKNSEILGKLLLDGQKVAKELSIDQSGYRLIINTHKAAGQMIDHIHMHLMGGEKLKEI